MTIYTKTGDFGQTSLAGGTRVSKADPRVEAYGVVDEANCLVGLALAASPHGAIAPVLGFVQQRLSNCAARIATPPQARDVHIVDVSEEDVTFVERAIDTFEESSAPLRGFVVSGGSELAARLHVARTVVRRAERRVVSLESKDPGDLRVLRFLNRLSDLLFSAARVALAEEGVAEVAWDPGIAPPEL